MKLKPAAIASMLAKPEAPRLWLVYGADASQVRDTALSIRQAAEAKQPLVERKLTQEQVTAGEILLADELRAVSLLGDVTFLHLTQASDGITKALRELEQLLPCPNLLIVESGTLGPRSTLRQWFEKQPQAAAVACYAEEGASLFRQIEQWLAAEELTADREMVQYLAGQLQGQQGALKQEMTKLALYKGGAGAVNEADLACLSVPQAQGALDDVICALMDGNAVALDRALQSAQQEGVALISLLRSLGNYVLRLLDLHARQQAGTSLDMAMKQCRPPVFFKQQAQVRRHLQAWPADALCRAAALICAMELMAKQSSLAMPHLAGSWLGLKMRSVKRPAMSA